MAIRKVIPRSLDSAAASANLNFDAGTLFVDSTNNRVGINQTSPALQLHVSASGENLALFQNSASSPALIRLRDNTTTNDPYIAAYANSMAFGQYGSSEFARFTSTGLGIGTTSPSTKLDVNGIITTTPGIGSSGQYVLGYGNNGSSRSWRMRSDSNAFGDFAIEQTTTQTGSTYDAKLLINPSGNVGIGTSSPSSLLQISKALSSTQTSALQIQNTGIFTWGIGIDNAVSSTSLLFQSSGAGGTTRMAIDSSGNVGVGLSSPQTKLDIAGTIRLTPNPSDTNYTADIFASYDSGHPFQINVKNNGSTFETLGVYADGGGSNNRACFPSFPVVIGATSRRSSSIKLDISTGGVMNLDAVVIGPTSGTATVGDVVKLGFALQNTAGGGTGNLYAAAIGGIQDKASSNGGALGFYTQASAGDGTPERMRITSSGYLGLGTSSPDVRLTVSGGSVGNTTGKAAFYCGGDENSVSAARNEAIRIGRADTVGSYYSSIWSASGSSSTESLHWLKFYISNGNGSSQTLACSMFGTGDVAVAGAISKGSGSFRIDHPLPQLEKTHELVHSFIEGPQADLIYRGKVNLVAGTATVNIDTAARMTQGTFEVLCRDVQCFTTNESDWTAVRGSVNGNILTIEAQDSTSTASISWMVIGERKDKHMYDTGWTDDDGKVIVEPLKVQPEEIAPVETE